MKDKKPIIGIVGRPIVTKENYEAYVTFEKVRKAVIQAGGIPISILPVDLKTYSLDNYQKEELSDDAKEDLKRMIHLCDGVILQGGSKWYSYDEFISSYVVQEDIPTLGICLGMQLLSYIDTSLKPVLIESNLNHEQKGAHYVHSVTILENTLLDRILEKKTILVNSNHKHKVIKTKEFKVSAISEDGVIEAIYHPLKKCLLGVQFHPESMIFDDENDLKIFQYFISKCE